MTQRLPIRHTLLFLIPTVLCACLAATATAQTEPADNPQTQQTPEPTPVLGRFEVILINGRIIEADWFLETDQHIELGIGPSKARFGRFQIREIRRLEPPELEFRQLRLQIDDNNLDARYDLAYRFYEQGYRDIALPELADLRVRFPDSHKVTVLFELIREQIAAEDRLRREEAAEAILERNVPDPVANDPHFILTPQQISLLRLWEMPDDLSTVRPRVRVPQEVLEDVLTRYTNHPAFPTSRAARTNIRKGNGFDQLQLIFDLEAREVYHRIEVLSDPPALKTFMGVLRRGYHTRYFVRHFNAQTIPELPLARTGIDPAQAYADFATLAVTRIEGLPMFDRKDPAASLYLQWGLPRELAQHPAPQIPRWRPYFSGPDDRIFRFLVDWIDGFYDFPGLPDYGFPWPPDPQQTPTQPPTIAPAP
ncbi:hypothetical protein [Mucisphaera sp.]|uniref:hypothetical protein n=1 Tax=Mucisphaera sp. TaxID=2913024 RepID=UPI003D10337A